MPQLLCETPDENQMFLVPGQLQLADGHSEGGALERVMVQLSNAAASGLPAQGKEATLDETQTVWSVTDLGDLQVGANFVNIWAQFVGGAMAFREARPITGFDMAILNPRLVPDAPPPAAAALRAPALAAAIVDMGLPPAFSVRFRRTHLAFMSGDASAPKFLSTLLNSRILQAEPIRLEFDFSRSNWTTLVWSAVRDTLQPEDPESASVWALEIPVPPGQPWIARLHLRRTTAVDTYEDQWYRVGFDPTAEQSFHSTTLGVHILKVSPLY